MDASKVTTATFFSAHDLTVRKAGNGIGVISLGMPSSSVTCGFDCNTITHTYEHGSVVSVATKAYSGTLQGVLCGACTGRSRLPGDHE